MTTFFKINKELNRYHNKDVPIFFNDKKTSAYHHINQIHNNIYEIYSVSSDNIVNQSNVLYITGDNKTYKAVNFKNEYIQSILQEEISASKDTIPEILAQLAKNSQVDFEFYAKPFDIVQSLQRSLAEINRLFIFSKKCKKDLYSTVLALNAVLTCTSDETQVKLTSFLNAFKSLIEEVKKNQKNVRRSRIIQVTILTASVLLSYFACFMPIFISASLVLPLVLPLILSGLLIFGLGLAFYAFSLSSYDSVYSSKDNVNSIESMYTQINFFSEVLQNKHDVIAKDTGHTTDNTLILNEGFSID